MLHKAERRTATTQIVRETEAEAIAFVVSKTIGLDTGRASADYIHLYHGNAALLTESLEVIQRTSALILSALEAPRAEDAQEAEPEMAQATLFHFPLIPTVATRAQRKWKGRSEAEVCTSEARKIGEWLAGARGGAP